MKRVVEYKIGQDIPSNAVFLYCKDAIIRGSKKSIMSFFYEVPDRVKRSSNKTIKHFEKEIDVIIDALNYHAGKSYSKKTEKTRKLIFKWLKQGYTIDQFETAIKNMCNEWLTNPDMCQYLRPETLFGNKFEGYYNKGQAPTEQDIFSELDGFMKGDDDGN